LKTCQSLKEHLKTRVKKWDIHHNELTLWVEKESLLAVLDTVKKHSSYLFAQLCGVDFLGKRPRFQVVYYLLSIAHNQRLRLKVPVEEEGVASATSLFKSAGWWERETFDLFGIPFEGHPDLRRILTDYNFEGYPLRKDFPLTGYEEVRYDNKKQVVYEPVRLPPGLSHL